MSINWKKNVALFLTSQSISMLGSSLVQYAMMWYITLETKSGSMMTVFILCGFVPTFFLSPFAGVWADRYNRKILIALSDSVIALVTLFLAIVFLSGYKAAWLIFVISAVRALGSAVQSPSVGAFLPQITPQEKLTAVNGTNASIQSIIMLISPIVSGALLSVAPIEIIFFIDVVTAIIGVGTLLLFLHVPPHTKALEKQETHYLADLKLGFQYIFHHKFVRSLFLFFAAFTFFAAPVAFLTPLQVTRSFGSDVWRLTAIEIAFSVGMTLGGAAMASWGGFRNRMHSMALSGVLIGTGTLVLGVVTNFPVYLLFMGLVGAAMPLFNTPATVLLQEKVEPDYMGRVFGVLTMITSSAMPLGMLLFGPMSDAVKIEWMLIVTGIIILIEGILLTRSKVMMQAGERENKEE